jgi:hypothetical protein
LPRREPSATPFVQREIARTAQKSALKQTAASPKPQPLPIFSKPVAGIAAENPEDVEKLVSDLRSHGFKLTQEGSFSEFLGIKFLECSEDEKTITMTQKGLIQKIITKASKMESKLNPCFNSSCQR